MTMDDLTPLGSQENRPPSTVISTKGEVPISSPALSVSGSRQGSKPRKPPTITPRSFTRFFTPKSSLERGGRIGASRQALRDITAAASNRRRRRTLTKDTIQIFDEELNGRTHVAKKRKTDVLESVDITPDRSSPLKRIRNQSLEISEDGAEEPNPNSEDEGEDFYLVHGRQWRNAREVDPIVPSNYRTSIGKNLCREIGAYGRIMKPRNLHHDSKDWQHETSNFFSRPEDIHVCNNVALPVDRTIPFCTVSCNSGYT